VLLDGPGQPGAQGRIPWHRPADARGQLSRRGHLSIEFTDAAPDDEQPWLGTWLELRADDPAAVHWAALDAGLAELRPSVLLPDSRRPGVHHRSNKLNAAVKDVHLKRGTL
jgi:hypothetical protein